MRCERCGGRTAVISSHRRAELDANTRVRSAEGSLGDDVARWTGDADQRTRVRRCRDPRCGHTFATVELTRAVLAQLRKD
jgi:hypothetical protein